MKRLGLIGIVLAVTTLQGCSGQHWYDGLRMVRENQCYNTTTNDIQRENCLSSADVNYSQYTKDRQETPTR
jgi:hypothetical protein